MMGLKPLFRNLALPMAMVFAIATLPAPQAAAEMIATDQIVNEELAADSRDKVESFLARDDVRQQLESLGVDPGEAQARVDSLSDQEAMQLAQQIDQMPAGQGAIGAVIGAAVLIFIVLLITDLLGFTSVFGFTNKGSANPS
ncbi:MAG: PA2779 family protein [Limibacillus sp.]|jgi:cytochrome c1